MNVKGRIRLWASVILILSSTGYSVFYRSGIAQAASCGGAPHYYAEVASNTGNFYGTGAWTTTWGQWSLDGHTNSFSDTAVWVWQYGNLNDAVEAGLETGTLLGYGYNSGMFAYYTKNNDQTASDSKEGPDQPTNTNIWEEANSNGTTSWPSVNNWPSSGISYGVGFPHVSWAQGETYLYTDIWMAGGTGQDLNLYYQDRNTGNWYQWGIIDYSCADSPYGQYNNGVDGFVPYGY